MFTKVWKNSNMLAGFCFYHPVPEDFTTCCWQREGKTTTVWLAYRIFLGLYFVATFIYVLLCSMIVPPNPEDRFKFFIFLTNWTYTLETILYLLAAIMTILAFKQRNKEGSKELRPKLPWYYKMYWVFYSITLTVSVLVTSVFWIKVYDPAIYPLNDRTFILHTFNSVLMLIDFIFIAHPIRFFHVYCPILYSLVYLLFSVIYEFSGGTGIRGVIPIYRILDWKEDPTQACWTSLMALSVIFTVHSIYSLLSTGKMALRRSRY